MITPQGDKGNVSNFKVRVDEIKILKSPRDGQARRHPPKSKNKKLRTEFVIPNMDLTVEDEDSD